MQEITKRILKKSLKIVRKSSKFRRIFDQCTFEELDLYDNEDWENLDRIFTTSRSQLFNNPSWRYGPERVHEVAEEAIKTILEFTSIDNKTYCDLGCGTHHPFGTSTIFYLNGASSTIAIDAAKTNSKRAAKALYDLLVECLIKPNDWHFSNIKLEDFLTRTKEFDFKELRDGNLEAGIATTPLKHITTDIHNPQLSQNSIDIMSSRAVLEHFLDFKTAVKNLYLVMSEEGIAYHHIDLRDHRAYINPDNYHWWSFLAEKDDWSDGLCNRLRFSEIRQYFEEAGFEILRYEGRKEKMPEDFRAKLKGRFSAMSDEELNITGVFCVLKKSKP